MGHDRICDSLRSTRGTSLTRRGLLQRAGWAAAATALPRSITLGADSVSPVMVRLSSYMSDARDRALPDDVV